MKLNVGVDLSDFMDYFNSDEVDKMIAEDAKEQIMKIVKKDPKYKAYINKKSVEVLNGIEI